MVEELRHCLNPLPACWAAGHNDAGSAVRHARGFGQEGGEVTAANFVFGVREAVRISS